jgi:hypothetical protein
VCSDLVIAETEAEGSGEHVPRLIVGMVDVERRDPVVADLGRPLSDDEAIAH